MKCLSIIWYSFTFSFSLSSVPWSLEALGHGHCAFHHRKRSRLTQIQCILSLLPVQDYKLTRARIARVRGDDAPPLDVFFIHANFPKFNPATVFEAHEVNPAFTDDGEYTRAWTIPEEVVGRFSQVEDVERAFWKEVKWAACELEERFVSLAGI